MIRNSLALLTLVLSVNLAACAAGTAGEGSRRDPDEISQSEFTERGVVGLTVFDVITRLRPGWLRARGSSSATFVDDQFPAVMIDESRQSIEVLRSLRTSDVSLLRYVSGPDATTRYGTGYVNGLIEVSTVRR